jgi:hypothetical protein
MISVPSSTLTLAGNLRFDLLKDKTDAGETTTLQPNLDLRLTSRVIQMGVGYRALVRTNTIISGTETLNVTDNTKEVFVDSTISAGKLPSLRLRYNIRDQSQRSGGEVKSSSDIHEFNGGMNYRIGIFQMNLDYRDSTGKDKITGSTTGASQISGQASMSKRLGAKIDLGLRESYNFASSTSGGQKTSEKYTSTSEGRISFNPLRGMSINGTYTYRLAGDLINELDKSTETSWVASMSYALPKFLRFYGVYSTRETEATDSLTGSDTTIAGVNFNHRVGKLNITSRFERRYDNNTRTAKGITTQGESVRNNFDWLMTARLARYLNLTLSESYVNTESGSKTTSSDRYRLKADIGPVKSLTLSPYLDHTINTAATGAKTKNTDIVVPATFRLSLHKKLEVNLTDSFTWRTSEQRGAKSSSQSNNAVLRLTLNRPFPGTTISGDASFTSSSSSAGVSSTTSAYSLRVNWSKASHSLNADLHYQTGSNAVDSASLALQYGLNFYLGRFSMDFQARYSYSITYSIPESTGQVIYVVFNLNK